MLDPRIFEKFLIFSRINSEKYNFAGFYRLQNHELCGMITVKYLLFWRDRS